jgi:PAS domain S-box-containing protein
MTYIDKNNIRLFDDASLHKLIIETANEGIWILDDDRRTVFVNKKMASMLGYAEVHMIGRSIFEFVEDASCMKCRQVIASWDMTSSTQQELPFTAANGNLIWLSMNISTMVRDEARLGILAMVTDITESKRTAEELLEKQQIYTALFEDLPIPIWDEDFSEIKKYIDQKKAEGIRDFRTYFQENPDKLIECTSRLIVNDINQAVVDLNEANSKEIVLREFRKLVTSKSNEYAIEQLVAIAENRTTCEFDAELLTFGKNIRYVNFRWTVVKGHEDTYKKVYLSTTDLTRRIVDENLALQDSNREKAVLLKEIHHRVKNNLQIITSLLNLQSHTIEDEAMRTTFETSVNRIKSMATIHEMLYRSNDFSEINYREYLQTLVDSLINSLKGMNDQIRFTLDVDTSIKLNINTSIPLGLMINELVTNALKHGFNETHHGEIYLSMHRDENREYFLRIGDNGDGIPEGTDILNSETLGLQLVASLIQQISGTLELDTARKGTHYLIRFAELEAHHDDPISSRTV